jgi:nucleoside phosphorylase
MRRNHVKLLVVAAWEPELSAFRERCVARPLPLPREGIAVEPIGVGIVEAAIGMTRCVLRHEPTHALLIGTCGAFEAASLPLGSVVTSRSVTLADASVLERSSELPPPMPGRAALDPALHDALVAAGAKSVQIANTVGITTDDALASRLSAAGEVEHLEAFAFARACAAASIPCGVALGVANTVGSRGRDEWKAGHASASERAAGVAYDALASFVRTSTTAR